MIDVKLPIRKAFYDLLNGQLTYGLNMVPVVDDIKNLGDAATAYVLLSNQVGVDASTFQTFDSDETLVLDIVFKAGSRSNKAVPDGIAGQILPLLMPAPGVNGLVPSASIQINCVQLHDDRYMPAMFNGSNTVTRRLLTFKMHVRQTGSTSPVMPLPAFQNPIVSAVFESATQYGNQVLKGKSFLLYLNGVGFLENGVQWDYLNTGGFEILLNDFDATRNSYVFYLLLQ